jgi:hypothetical protein
MPSNVFDTSSVVGAEAEAAAAPASKKKMVRGFAGTVDKETTPSVDERMALLRLQVLKEREEAAQVKAASVSAPASVSAGTGAAVAEAAVGEAAAGEAEAVPAAAGAEVEAEASWYKTDDGAQIFSTGN